MSGFSFPLTSFGVRQNPTYKNCRGFGKLHAPRLLSPRRKPVWQLWSGRNMWKKTRQVSSLPAKAGSGKDLTQH